MTTGTERSSVLDGRLEEKARMVRPRMVRPVWPVRDLYRPKRNTKITQYLAAAAALGTREYIETDGRTQRVHELRMQRVTKKTVEMSNVLKTAQTIRVYIST